jgi:hypothetical protein
MNATLSIAGRVLGKVTNMFVSPKNEAMVGQGPGRFINWHFECMAAKHVLKAHKMRAKYIYRESEHVNSTEEHLLVVRTKKNYEEEFVYYGVIGNKYYRLIVVRNLSYQNVRQRLGWEPVIGFNDGWLLSWKNVLSSDDPMIPGIDKTIVDFVYNGQQGRAEPDAIYCRVSGSA